VFDSDTGWANYPFYPGYSAAGEIAVVGDVRLQHESHKQLLHFQRLGIQYHQTLHNRKCAYFAI
jgi:hypothetical protein